MDGTCPQCRARLELPASGHYECGHCRTRFEVALGSPRPVPSASLPPGWPAPGGYGYSPPGNPGPAAYPAPVGAYPPPPAAPQLGAPCSVHPGNAAATVCERCGDFMCALCTTPFEGRMYCPRCFDLLYNRGSLEFRQRQFTLPGTTLALGISSLLCSPFVLIGVPLGIGGLYAGLKALKEHREHPDLPNRNMTLFGVGTSILGLVVAVAMVVVLVVLILRAK